jgi:hypothetical protein
LPPLSSLLSPHSSLLSPCGPDSLTPPIPAEPLHDLGPYLGAGAHLFIVPVDQDSWEYAHHDHAYVSLDFGDLDSLSRTLCDDVSMMGVYPMPMPPERFGPSLFALVRLPLPGEWRVYVSFRRADTLATLAFLWHVDGPDHTPRPEPANGTGAALRTEPRCEAINATSSPGWWTDAAIAEGESLWRSCPAQLPVLALALGAAGAVLVACVVAVACRRKMRGRCSTPSGVRTVELQWPVGGLAEAEACTTSCTNEESSPRPVDDSEGDHV